MKEIEKKKGIACLGDINLCKYSDISTSEKDYNSVYKSSKMLVHIIL